MRPPQPLKRGPRFLIDWLNELLDYVIQTTPISGINTSTVAGPNGIAVNAYSRNSSDSQSDPETQFSLSVVSAVIDGPSLYRHPAGIRVRLGTVSNVIPEDMHLTDLPIFVLPITSGSGIIYLRAEADANRDIVAASIQSTTSSSVPDDTETYFNKIIGTYNATFGDQPMRVTTDIKGSQWLELCGGVRAIWGVT